MTKNLKKVWVTPRDGSGLMALTLESSTPCNETTRLSVREWLVPLKPSPRHPLRHTIVISLLGEEDINLLAQFLDTIRTDQ